MVTKTDLINLINSNDLPGDLTEIYDNLCNNFGLMSLEDQESAEVRELKEYIKELEEIVNEFMKDKGIILP